MSDVFADAVDAIGHSEGREGELSQPFLSVVPVAGAAVSTMGEFLGTETVSASDHQAARLDELQFDLGEGPCWDALNSGAVIAEPDLRERPRGVWPAFAEAIRNDDVGAIYAFPLLLGTLRLGAVELYDSHPRELSPLETQQTEALAALVSRVLLRRAIRTLGHDVPEDDNPFSRRTIHQATGMVLAQMRVSADDARLMIQGHAFAEDRPLREVARDILDGRLDFSADATGKEGPDGPGS